MQVLRRQVLCSTLLLTALLLRGVLPLGYMPGGDGALIAFCTPSGLQQQRAADQQESPAAGAHQECPYGFALGMGALVPADVAVPVFAASAPERFSRAIAPLVSIAGPPFSARGPPSLV